MPLNLKMSELETERLRLRAFRESDLPDIARWDETSGSDRFLEFCLRSYREWGMGPWAMVLKETGVIAGNCSFCRIGYERDRGALEYCGEVNYFVARPHRGKGFASEALHVMLRFGFDDMRLTRIQGRCAPENVSSERVLQKAGLRFDRMIAGAEGSAEEKLYAITREEYLGLP
ncbi:MAG: GNAT family N-acetyltransferase [Candidatus Sulfotelmatobacter sp.]